MFHTKLATQADKTISIVKAACVLHNYILNTREPRDASAAITIDQAVETARTEAFTPLEEDDSAEEGTHIRERLLDYFVDENPLSWQRHRVERGTF